MINKYPYTDASQLNLDWFLTEFKKLYDEWVKMKENNAQMVIKYDNMYIKYNNMVLEFGDLTQTVQTFTTFVENYFDNLDVQQEINNKLDEMVQQGTLQPLLQPFVVEALPDVVEDQLPDVVTTQLPGEVQSQLPGVVTTQLPGEVQSQLPGVVTTQLPGEVQSQLPGVVEDQIDAAVASPAATATSAWLTANVNPVGSAVVVDSSLTVAGAAADAKVTGDDITELNKNYKGYPEIDSKGVTSWANNTFSTNTGGYINDSHYVRCNDYLLFTGEDASPALFSVASGFICRVLKYSTPATADYTSEWFEVSDGDYAILNTNYYYRVTMRKADGSTITTSDLPANPLTVTTYINLKKLDNDVNGDYYLVKRNDLKRGVYSSGSIVSQTNRLASRKFYTYAKTKVKYTTTNLQIYILEFDTDGNQIYNSGWISTPGETIIPYSGYIAVQFKYANDATLPLEDFNETVQIYNTVRYELTKLADIDNIVYSYNVSGEPLNLKVQKYNVEKMTLEASPSTIEHNIQGLAISNGCAFILYNDDIMEIRDITTGAQVTTLSLDSNRGDSIQFSDEYYDPDDEFPLAYIDAKDGGDPRIAVFRITRSAATLIQEIRVPAAQVGYYSSPALDPATNCLYELGYYGNSFNVQAVGIDMILTIWDLDNMTQNNDNSYTPALIARYEHIPFINTVQDTAFVDGRYVALSSPPNNITNDNTHVFFIDPSGQIQTRLNGFPAGVRNTEVEGITFIEDSEGKKYEMILLTTNGKFYRITFS